MGPHCHFTTASSLPLAWGWYSQSATQPASGGGAPASPGHTGGRSRHLPPSGSGWVHTPPSGPLSGTPASDCEPSAVSQYWPGAQSLAVWQSLPGVTHLSKRQTVAPAQQSVPQTSDADGQHAPLTQTPPLQLALVVHAPESPKRLPPSLPPPLVVPPMPPAPFPAPAPWLPVPPQLAAATPREKRPREAEASKKQR